MPLIERSGIYRNADGSARWLRKDQVVAKVDIAGYEIDESAPLSAGRAAIVAAEQRVARAVAHRGYVAFRGLEPAPSSAPVGLDGDENADTSVSGRPVEMRIVSTVSYPAAIGAAESSTPIEESAPVMPQPNKRRSRKPKDMQTPEDHDKPIATPEDSEPAHEERD